MFSDHVTADGVIHDMRNVMTVITNNCTILADSVPKEKSSILIDIAEAISHLGSMLKCLPKTTEKGTTHHANISAVIAETTGILSISYPSVGFSVQGDDVDLRIDRCDLFRILVNLLSNAIDAALANPLREPRVAVSVSQQDLTLSIADSGTGFGSLDLHSAFLPYVTQREHSPSECTSPDHEGLGLYVVQSIVASYGGWITTERTDVETVLTLHFPPDLSV